MCNWGRNRETGKKLRQNYAKMRSRCQIRRCQSTTVHLWSWAEKRAKCDMIDCMTFACSTRTNRQTKQTFNITNSVNHSLVNLKMASKLGLRNWKNFCRFENISVLSTEKKSKILTGFAQFLFTLCWYSTALSLCSVFVQFYAQP